MGGLENWAIIMNVICVSSLTLEGILKKGYCIMNVINEINRTGHVNEIFPFCQRTITSG